MHHSSGPLCVIMMRLGDGIPSIIIFPVVKHYSSPVYLCISTAAVSRLLPDPHDAQLEVNRPAGRTTGEWSKFSIAT
jgi:hypothetical protein